MKGGKRPGAGRKKGFAALEAEGARKLIAELLSREVAPVAEALIKKAKKGDIRAAQLLFERAWGKSLTAEPSTSTVGLWRPVKINYVVPKPPSVSRVQVAEE